MHHLRDSQDVSMHPGLRQLLPWMDHSYNLLLSRLQNSPNVFELPAGKISRFKLKSTKISLYIPSMSGVIDDLSDATLYILNLFMRAHN